MPMIKLKVQADHERNANRE